jgi:5-methylcytosine-specific restriction endonuclease McrA
MDNTRGYEPDNVVPCCKNCNVLKSNKYTPEETKVMMEALLAFRKRNIPDSAA